MKLPKFFLMAVLFPAMSQAASWSVTAIPDVAFNPAPANQITFVNTDYLLRATRTAWVPSGYPTTKVTFNFEVNVDNSTDGSATRVSLCSKDRWDNHGTWVCTSLKASGSVINVGTCTTNYCRPNTHALLFSGSTTYFNSWHNSDNGGYIIKIRHVSASSPVDTTLLNGSIINYY